MERPTVVFLSLCDFALSFLVDFFFVIHCACETIHFGSFPCIACSCSGNGKKKKKKAAKVSLCCVSLGVGNEGLSNGNSYFILSIIYGETRFRKGHCMLVISIPLESQLEGVQINGDTCFC